MKHKHADMLLQYALDAMETSEPWWRWQFRIEKTDNPRWTDASFPLSFVDHTLEYRRNPEAPPVPWHLLDQVERPLEKVELKPVDMSVLVGSGIDCEFFELGDFPDYCTELSYLCELHQHKEGWLYRASSGDAYSHCRPKMNYWFSDFNFQDVFGTTSDLEAAGFELDARVNIFCIEGLQEGYCWPWESEGNE